MPKVVDHELRRRELARAALRVIGRDGLEAATTRAVADESGWSTGVLKHYFDDKDHLLHEALRELERMNLERFERARRSAGRAGRDREPRSRAFSVVEPTSRVCGSPS